MLDFYIKSVIVYLILYLALKKISKTIMLNRNDVDYKEYATNGKEIKKYKNMGGNKKEKC